MIRRLILRLGAASLALSLAFQVPVLAVMEWRHTPGSVCEDRLGELGLIHLQALAQPAAQFRRAGDALAKARARIARELSPLALLRRPAFVGLEWASGAAAKDFMQRAAADQDSALGIFWTLLGMADCVFLQMPFASMQIRMPDNPD